jgi:hypothetical protein
MGLAAKVGQVFGQMPEQLVVAADHAIARHAGDQDQLRLAHLAFKPPPAP